MRPRGKAGRKPGHNIIIWGQTKARWPNGAIPRPEAKPLSRACGARPSRGVSRGEMAFRWKAPKRRERWFSRRDALCASVNTALRKPGHVIATHGSTKGPWPKGDNVVLGVMLSLWACGARPSAGRASSAQMA